MIKTIKNGPKPTFATYQKTLERKAAEVRNSMSAQKAAQVVARLDVPSDEGDLSQQHHEEWIFLNRNTIDMKLLREISDALPWARYCVTCQEMIATRIAEGEMVEYQEADR